MDIDHILANAKAQRDCWHFIDQYKTDHNGNPPPRNEIAKHLKCTKQNVDTLLLKLKDKHLIIMDEYERPMIPDREYPPPPEPLAQTNW